VVKSTDCSSRGPEFNSQQPHGGSQPSVMGHTSSGVSEDSCSVLTDIKETVFKKRKDGGWGFSSVVERLPRKRKARGSVPSSGKKKKSSQELKGKVRVRRLEGWLSG